MPLILISRSACQVVPIFFISDRIDKKMTLNVLIHLFLNSGVLSMNFFLNFQY